MDRPQRRRMTAAGVVRAAGSYWGVLLLAGFTSGQNVDKPARMGPALHVLPCAGLPVSFDQTEERSRRESGGSTDNVVARSKVFRDSSGRIRLEADTYTLLLDPIAGSSVVLLSQEQLAIRTPWPGGGKEVRLGINISMGIVSSTHEMTVTTQDIGERWIEGIKFTGTRIVQSAKGEPQPTTTYEDWYSTELHLSGLVLASSRQETHITRIENLRREEPDGNLFTIPPDHKILELELGEP